MRLASPDNPWLVAVAVCRVRATPTESQKGSRSIYGVERVFFRSCLYCPDAKAAVGHATSCVSCSFLRGLRVRL